MAAECGQVSLVDMLLKRDVQVDLQNNVRTMLVELLVMTPLC